MTREEAIRRIKIWHLDDDDMEVLSVVIPELAESEDERIRKKLYNTVLGTPSNSEWFDGFTKEQMLAYLEKQKEQPGGSSEKPNSHVEWSEEDVVISEHELTVLKLVAEKDGTFLMGLYNKLKSFRPQPHWKPSEEQMRSLQAVINDPNNAGSESCQLALKDLYIDLQLV